MKQENEIEADYFGLAAAWDEELYGKLKSDRKVAYIVAGTSMFLAILAIAAVMMLTPLKTTEPYIILVDKTTGYAETVRKLTYNQENSLTENEAVVLRELNEYVIARQTFDPQDLEKRFEKVQLSTEATEFQQYVAEVRTDNDTMGALSERTVSVKSIVPNLQNKIATVRFSTSTTVRNQTEVEHWIATINYDFKDLPIELTRKFINPLGFIVTNYRVDSESIN